MPLFKRRTGKPDAAARQRQQRNNLAATKAEVKRANALVKAALSKARAAEARFRITRSPADNRALRQADDQLTEANRKRSEARSRYVALANARR